MAVQEKRYWQNLDELRARREETSANGDAEFPDGHHDDDDPLLASSRRDFLKMMGLTFTAGLAASACAMPVQKAIPLLNKPEEITPGVANWYASSCGACAAGCGILVKNRDGRPIKIEGNPDHPLSKGGLCAVGQASVLPLYDNRRLRGPQIDGRQTSWQTLDSAVLEQLGKLRDQGQAIVLLSSTVTSPSTLSAIQEFTAAYPSTRHVVYDSVSASAIREAHREMTGVPILPGYDFEQAQIIVGLEADFLGTWISPVEFTKQYVKNRKLEGKTALSYHVQFESGMTITGASADKRIPTNPSERALLVLWLYEQIFIKANPAVRIRPMVAEAPLAPDLLAELVEVLWQNRGKSVIVSGGNDIAEQLLVAQLNILLGNYGKALSTSRPSLQKQGSDADMIAFTNDLAAGKIGALIVLHSNPVYDSPMAGEIQKAMATLPLTLSFAGSLDETAALAKYVAPDHYFLESWGDAHPRVGTYSLFQPSVTPLFDTRAALEGLLRFMGRQETAYEYIQNYWRTALFPTQNNAPSFQSFWDKSVHDGVFRSRESRSYTVLPVSGARLQSAMRSLESRYQKRPGADVFEIALYEKVAIQDGHHAGNPWLQELPDPITRVSWANYVSMAPQTALDLSIAHGDIVQLQKNDRTIELPVFIQPGQAARTLSVAVGYGRDCLDRRYGENAYPFAAYENNFLKFEGPSVTLAKTGRRYTFAAMQIHSSMEGRPIAIETTLDEYKKDPHAGQPEDYHLLSLWERHEKKGHFWGMTIDLNSCTGCNACVVACQVENNVPVVGEKEIRRNRDMYWLRIDRYYSGSADAPQTVFQPMLCQHCENAPCETVCPVLATVHSSEGLSQQIYNRCVGTRYCANNCPYKVRRFNWFNYNKDGILDDDLSHMVLNPDVTVRSRGVMEKCSMCAQRIQAGKNKAAIEGRPVRDGEIQTACAQSCPADAIVFGDMLDPVSRVKQLKKHPRNYRVLEELGTRPVVSYLTKVKNTLV